MKTADERVTMTIRIKAHPEASRAAWIAAIRVLRDHERPRDPEPAADASMRARNLMTVRTLPCTYE